MVSMLWDVQHMRYHGGACNLKRLGLVKIRLSFSWSPDLSDMGHCNYLAGRGPIYLAVSDFHLFSLSLSIK